MRESALAQQVSPIDPEVRVAFATGWVEDWSVDSMEAVAVVVAAYVAVMVAAYVAAYVVEGSAEVVVA